VIDTHAHLDGCSEPAAVLMERARAAGVERVVTVGSGIPSCRESLRIADAEAGVFAAVGIHPHLAGDATAADVDGLRELLRHAKAVAVGEAGLDYYRDYAPRARQREVFEAQAALAEDTGKPLVVHARSADADVLDVLLGLSPSTTVILHCFSSPALLPMAIDRGWYVSFAGNVSYPKAGELREAALEVPSDRLLAETDCPYLAPQSVRGRPNEPAYVREVLDTLASARGEDPLALEHRIDANASTAFGIA
jgi:TatD DNase family protein